MSLPQLVERLVEVPTILYFLKQKVDIPVPGGGGGRSSRFSPWTEFNRCRADRWYSGGGLQGFRPGQRSSASSSSSHSPAGVHGDADEPGEGFFSHFSPALECDSAAERQLIRAERSSNGSCRPAPGLL